MAIMQCRSTEKNKKLSNRKQISRQHSCHTKNWTLDGMWSTLQIFHSSSVIAMKNLFVVSNPVCAVTEIWLTLSLPSKDDAWLNP